MSYIVDNAQTLQILFTFYWEFFCQPLLVMTVKAMHCTLCVGIWPNLSPTVPTKWYVFTLIHIGEVTAKNTDGHPKAAPVEIKILSFLCHEQVCHAGNINVEEVKCTLKIHLVGAKNSYHFVFFVFHYGLNFHLNSLSFLQNLVTMKMDLSASVLKMWSSLYQLSPK